MATDLLRSDKSFHPKGRRDDEELATSLERFPTQLFRGVRTLGTLLLKPPHRCDQLLIMDKLMNRKPDPRRSCFSLCLDILAEVSKIKPLFKCSRGGFEHKKAVYKSAVMSYSTSMGTLEV